MELTREMIEFIRQATWGEGRCQSAKLQEKGQEILRDIAKNLCRPTPLAPDGGDVLQNYDPAPDIERVSKQGYYNPTTGKA
jgi:hypothetical protein